MTVTRCTLRLPGGAVGHACVPGRDRDKARIAALCDALMQQPETAPRVEAGILAPLRAAADAAAADRAGRAAATRVDFFTLVRGEDQ
jgi:alpha-D-ribose 1-methylphosphonate 5-triphosphate synthase subunit PhnG